MALINTDLGKRCPAPPRSPAGEGMKRWAPQAPKLRPYRIRACRAIRPAAAMRCGGRAWRSVWARACFLPRPRRCRKPGRPPDGGALVESAAPGGPGPRQFPADPRDRIPVRPRDSTVAPVKGAAPRSAGTGGPFPRSGGPGVKDRAAEDVLAVPEVAALVGRGVVDRRREVKGAPSDEGAPWSCGVVPRPAQKFKARSTCKDRERAVCFLYSEAAVLRSARAWGR